LLKNSVLYKRVAMMKRFELNGLIVLLLFLFQCADPPSNGASSTENPSQNIPENTVSDIEEGEQLIRFQDEKTGKFGYKNAKEEVVVLPVYDGAMSFQTTMPTRVMIGDKFGFIGTDGTLIIPVEYLRAYPFVRDSKGSVIAKVSKKEKYFYINAKGEKVTSIK